MARMNQSADVSGALYVRVIDPTTGAIGFLPLEPAICPSSSMRFHRSRPPRAPIVEGVPLCR